MSCHALLQGIFPAQGLNPGLPHGRQILYQLSHQRSRRILEWVAYPSPGELPQPGIEPGSPALQADCLLSEEHLGVVSTFGFSSVAQLCPILCDPMNRSTPGLPVHHQLLESTQTLVHRVSDAIQLPYPLSSPSPPALNLSQHQGLFK